MMSISDLSLATITIGLGILTLICGAFTVLGFLLKWGIRFRLVGITSFMGVLTGGVFGLSLGLSTRVQIPGAGHYTLVYDTGASQTVIAVAPTITETELDATLRQAAGDLFSPGRISAGQLTIRARTIIHPEPGVSQPLFIGEVRRSLSQREDPEMVVEVFPEQLALVVIDN